jgi:uncharacterized protein YmfQ (DUF2313 family)
MEFRTSIKFYRSTTSVNFDWEDELALETVISGANKVGKNSDRRVLIFITKMNTFSANTQQFF